LAKHTDPNLVWIDLEMSGLDPEKDVILEIATIVTDKDLRILAEGPNIAIKQSDEVLNSMDEWNTKHHNQSGLVARVRRSQMNLQQAEEATVRFLSPFTRSGQNPLCGNTISQDRRFLYKYMPKLSDWLHYRNVDVTSLKELYFRWYPKLEEFKKQEKHLALDDIRESIAELEYYRKIMMPPSR
jgi:oligoribonuclease